MNIENTIDPVVLRPLYELAERGSGILREIAGKDAASFEAPIRWETPAFSPVLEPPPTRSPLTLNAIDRDESAHHVIQFLPKDFDDEGVSSIQTPEILGRLPQHEIKGSTSSSGSTRRADRRRFIIDSQDEHRSDH